MLKLGERQQGLATDCCRGPKRDLLVTMVTDDIGLDGSVRDIEGLADRVPEADGIEVGARSKDLARRETCQLLGHESEDVDWVGDHDEDGRRLDGLHLAEDVLEDQFVSVDECVSGFARAVVVACSHDNDVCLATVLEAGVADFGRGEEGGVLEVEHLPEPDLADIVDEELRDHGPVEAGKGDGGADHASANDGDFWR